jgi:hypothetical protein
LVADLADAHRAQNNADMWMAIPAIPGRTEYMQHLADQVRRALRNECTPVEALGETARRWSELTARLGPTHQRAAYRRSLGLQL